MTLIDKYGYIYPCLYEGENYAVVVDELALQQGYESSYAFVWKYGGRWVVSGYSVSEITGMLTELPSDTNSNDEFILIYRQFVEDWPDIKPILQKNLLKEML